MNADNRLDRERFHRTFSKLHASDGLLKEVYEMTTRKTNEDRSRISRRIIAVAAALALMLALAAAAYAADVFGIRALLLPDGERISLTKPQDVPDGLSLSISERVENVRAAWDEWSVWRDEYCSGLKPPEEDGAAFSLWQEFMTAEYGEYDWRYEVHDETMAAKLEDIADKYDLRLLTGTNVAWSSDTTGITGDGFYTNEALAEKTAEFAGSGNIFARTPDGFDKVYWYGEGSFCVSWYYDLPNGTRVTCYGYNSMYSTLASGSDVVAEAGDISAYSERIYTAADGTEVTILSDGRNAYIYVYLENSFFVERVSVPGSPFTLNDSELNAIADCIIYSRIGQ